MQSQLIKVAKKTHKKRIVSEGCPSVGIQSGMPGIVSIHFDQYNVAHLTVDDAKWLMKTLELYTK